MIDAIIGWMGVAFGLMIAPPQLYKIIKTGRTKDVSLATYVFLVMAVSCYLFHAVYIKDTIFTVVNSVGIVVNSTILFMILKDRKNYR